MERLFGSLPAILNALGENTRVEEQLVFAAWKRVAGQQLNERTKPVEFFENRLIVAVENEMWRRHLESLAPEMVARLYTKLGEGKVKFIEFRVDPAVIGEFRRQTPAETEPAADLSDSLTAAAETIADPQLRKSLLDAAAIYLAKKD